mmetsp:Transcript_68687/g.192573  ORF Transcript_68687/g.192573 Transcript_68687/m.192573 type:complete len:206 (-) Transcript_68687:254-871(-)
MHHCFGHHRYRYSRSGGDRRRGFMRCRRWGIADFFATIDPGSNLRLSVCMDQGLCLQLNLRLNLLRGALRLACVDDRLCLNLTEGGDLGAIHGHQTIPLGLGSRDNRLSLSRRLDHGLSLCLDLFRGDIGLLPPSGGRLELRLKLRLQLLLNLLLELRLLRVGTGRGGSIGLFDGRSRRGVSWSLIGSSIGIGFAAGCHGGSFGG